MIAVKVRGTVTEQGQLVIHGLPFDPGDTVEVTVTRASPERAMDPKRYPLRGTPVTLVNPFEPVESDEWEAARS